MAKRPPPRPPPQRHASSLRSPALGTPVAVKIPAKNHGPKSTPNVPGSSSEPETAIRCYERWSGLAIVVHDLTGRLSPLLPTARLWHTRPLCTAVKSGNHTATCIAWEIPRLRPLLARDALPRIRICHAGLVEITAPIMLADRLAVVLFAGQRLPGTDLVAHERDTPSTAPAEWARHLPRPPRLDADGAAFAQEGLQQLAARLHAWLDGHHDLSPASTADKASSAKATANDWTDAPALERRRAILRYIDQHHLEALALTDLANHLRLAPHRTAHVVRALLDTTFITLLTNARLRTASALLTTTDLPIPDIANRSGFGDANHFHRVFRRANGTTPRRFRVQGDA